MLTVLKTEDAMVRVMKDSILAWILKDQIVFSWEMRMQNSKCHNSLTKVDFKATSTNKTRNMMDWLIGRPIHRLSMVALHQASRARISMYPIIACFHQGIALIAIFIILVQHWKMINSSIERSNHICQPVKGPLEVVVIRCSLQSCSVLLVK